jgi:hypothetical protein
MGVCGDGIFGDGITGDGMVGDGKSWFFGWPAGGVGGVIGDGGESSSVNLKSDI